jgi:probable phosphoglycerate mutase
MKQVTIYVDGALAGGQQVGIAAVARTRRGEFLGWLSRRLPRMTNNEAEYRAALLGLELAQSLGAESVEVVTDSQVVAQQMQGLSRVNSPRLKTLHQQACMASRSFREVAFRHVGREENKLADALAAEALAGRTAQ